MSTYAFTWIMENVPDDKIILEFGSGETTKYLSKKYNMYSVEEDNRFVGLYDSNYIYAPIVNDWYDLESLKKGIPEKYDVIILDGPAHGKREGFLDNIGLFSLDKIIVVDDIDREGDRAVWDKLVKMTKDQYDKKSVSVHNAGIIY